MFKNLKIGVKLILGFLVIIFLIGLLGIINYFGLSNIQEKADRIPPQQLAAHFSMVLTIETRFQEGALHTYMMERERGRSGTGIRADIDDSLENRYPEALNKLEELTTAEEGKLLFARTSSLYNSFEKAVKEIILLIEQDRIDEAHEQALKEVTPKGKESLQAQTDLILYHRTQLTNINAATQEAVENVTIVIFVITTLAILLGLGIAVFVSRNISNSVREARSVAVEIARGNMDVVVTPRSKDEIGELMQSLDKMRRSLKVVMEEYEKKSKK